MDEKILLKIYESLEKGESAALAVITQNSGSSPRKNGSLMAVWGDGSIFGSVGGGKIEAVIIEKAVECIKNKEDSNFEYKLTEKDLGMKCGGEVKGYIKVFYPRPRLIIAGGGHVGEKLYKLAKILDFCTVIMDDRDAFANKERFDEADEVILGDIGESLKNYEINERDFIVIVTRGHLQDKDALKAAVAKKPAYIGMIGSSRKIIAIMKDLLEEGISKEKLQEVYSPIGLDIASELPEEIALGILGQIVLVKNKGSLNHVKDLKNIWEHLQ